MLASFAALSLCVAATVANAAPPISDSERERILSHGPWPPKVSIDAKLAALGERLFYDPALSGTGSVLCASCHVPYRAFQDGRPRAFGLEQADRNTPTLLNVSLYRRFGWDGLRTSLAAQSIRPLLEPREMRSSAGHVAIAGRRLGMHGTDEEVLAEVGNALAAFQRTLLSGRTPFDDFRDSLEVKSYPEDALRGLRIFIAECSTCHAGPHFSSSAIVNGFRVPGLRNVALTAPYMHDGSVATLEQAVAHTGARDVKDLAAFLRSLTSVTPSLVQ